MARRDVPTCGLDERLGEVTRRVRAAGWDACVVVNAERVVLGLLHAKELEAVPFRCGNLDHRGRRGVLLCADRPAPSLVVGRDRAVVLLAADRLGLASPSGPG